MKAADRIYFLMHEFSFILVFELDQRIEGARG